METCKRCGKGFCPSRVRRIYGKLNKDFCSPTCFTNDAVEKFKLETDLRTVEMRKQAEEIIAELFVAGFISDNVMGSETRTAEAVEVIVEAMKKGE